MPGTVITFYSYKGGVGRSFALVNTATILASWGYRVLCVDWDLEAPGLDAYFRPHLTGPPSSGLADVFTAFAEGRHADPGTHITRLEMPVRGSVDFLPAGGDEDYVRKVQRLDWALLYRDHDLGAALQAWRQQWAADYHFVLIDSRTGITDIGGICTAQLPDILVTMFTANEQSLRGVQDVVRRADQARDKLPYENGRLLVLPVPARFESRDEYQQAGVWQRRFADELTPLFNRWISRRTPAELVLRHVTVPYVAFWSFGEQIAALQETTPSPDDICYSLQTIAALLAHRLDRTSLLAEGRDAFVAAAARGGIREETGPRYQVFLSFDPQDDEAARYAYACRAELDRRGLTAFLSPIRPGVHARGAGAANEALARSSSLIAIVSDRVLPEQQRDIEAFLRQSLDEESDRTVIPVLLPGASATDLPPAARQLAALRPEPEDAPEWVATELALTVEYRAAVRAYHALLADESPASDALSLFGRFVRIAEQARDHGDQDTAASAVQAATVVADLMSRQPADELLTVGEEAALLLRLTALLAEGGRHADALHHALAGLAGRRRLAKELPDDPAELTELAAALRTVADLQHDTGSHDEARRLLTEALDVLTRAAQPDRASVDVRLEHGQVLGALARLHVTQGDVESALRVIGEQQELLRSLIDRGRLGREAVGEFARASLKLAELLAVAGQPEQAVGFLTEGIADYRVVLSHDAGDADALRGIGTAALRLGDALIERDAPAARRHYEEAAQALRRLVGAEPDDEHARFDLASVLARIGSLDRNPAAAYQEALAVLERHTGSDKAVTRLRADLLARLGTTEMAAGYTDAGRLHLEQALTGSRRLLLADSADPEAHEIAFRVNGQLGSFALREGDLEEARRRARSAQESAKRIPWADSARRRTSELLAEIDQASAK